MSGLIVGEVFDAIEAGVLTKLTLAERLCLLAIAEKCHHGTRQGSVRKARLMLAVGRSERTTERVLSGLKERGIVRIVQRGYKAHGVSRAPVYELPPFMLAEAQASDGLPPPPPDGFPPSRVAEANEVASDCDEFPPSRVAEANGAERVREAFREGLSSIGLPPNQDELPPKSNELPPKQGWASATPPPLTSGAGTV